MLHTTWDSVKTRFAKFITIGIDTAKYQKTDHPDVELFITDSTKSYHFKENTGKIAENDLEVLYWFINLALETKTLRPTNSLTFETKIQNPDFTR